MADYSSSPGGGWTLISSTSLLETHKAALTSFYNSNGGIPVITSWASSNCCWAMSSSLRWSIDGAYFYPGGGGGGTGACCSCETYTGTYFFNGHSSLSGTETWTGSPVCSDNNNPGIFYHS